MLQKFLKELNEYKEGNIRRLSLRNSFKIIYNKTSEGTDYRHKCFSKELNDKKFVQFVLNRVP